MSKFLDVLVHTRSEDFCDECSLVSLPSKISTLSKFLDVWYTHVLLSSVTNAPL